MTPQEQQAPAAAQTVDRNVLRDIIAEMEENNPYGLGKYTDVDAELLGLPSLGSLRLAHSLVKQWMGSPYIPDFIAKSANPAGTFVATVIRGRELGFKMMESLACLYLAPGGRLGLYGTAMISLMRKSRIKLKFSEVKDGNGEIVGSQVYGQREDGDDYTATFTRADAIKAGLGNVHKTYPITMCRWRAVSELFRFLASDLSGGPLYTREELMEEEGHLLEEITREMDGKSASEPDFSVGRKTTPAAAATVPVETKIDVKTTENPKSDKPATTTPAAKAAEQPKTTPAPVLKKDQDDQPPLFTETVPADSVQVTDTPVKSTTPAPAQTQTTAPVTTEPTNPTPKVTPINGKKTVKDILTEFTDYLPTVSPSSLTSKSFPEFLRGFTGIGDLKKANRAQVDPALGILPHLLQDVHAQGFKSKFLSDPHGTGVECGAGWIQLSRYFQTEPLWPADVQALAISTAFERYPDSGGAEILEYFDNPAKVREMNHSELRTFMQVLARSRRAIKLRDAALKHSVSMIAIVGSWGLDLTKSTEAEVNAAMDHSLLHGLALQMPSQPDPGATPVVPEVDDTDELGLFE